LAEKISEPSDKRQYANPCSFLFMHGISVEEVSRLIESLSDNKAVQHDSTQTKFIKL